MALIKYINPTYPTKAVGGIVDHKHAAVIVQRARVRPTTVKSPAHTQVMNWITELSNIWESPLTDGQRYSWGVYGYNTPLINAWGQPQYIKGYAHFMRSNRPRFQHALPIIHNGPSAYGFPTFSRPVVNLSPDNADITVTIDNSEAWANETGAAMMFWASLPVSTALLSPPEIYRPVGVIHGNAGGIGITYTFTNPYAQTPNPVRHFIRHSVTRADGRLSAN